MQVSLASQVLPALLEELRNEAVQALALPLVLRIIAQQPPKDFMDVTLPALLPVAASVKVCRRPGQVVSRSL